MVALSHMADDIWEVANLAVAESHRNRGIATSLLQVCESHAQSLDGEVVLLATSMPGFYRRRGYRTVRGASSVMRKRLDD